MVLVILYFIVAGLAIQGIEPSPRGIGERLLAFGLGWLILPVLILQKAARD